MNATGRSLLRITLQGRVVRSELAPRDTNTDRAREGQQLGGQRGLRVGSSSAAARNVGKDTSDCLREKKQQHNDHSRQAQQCDCRLALTSSATHAAIHLEKTGSQKDYGNSEQPRPGANQEYRGARNSRGAQKRKRQTARQSEKRRDHRTQRSASCLPIAHYVSN